MTTESVQSTFKQFTGLFIGSSVVMIVLGALAMTMPFAAGIGISIFVGWLVVFSGFAHLAFAFAARGAGAFLWRSLLGIFYVVGGFYLVFHPDISLVSLTLILAVILFAEGVAQIVVFAALRTQAGSGWILFDGILTLVLGYLIWRSWPSGSTWTIGTLVGIKLLVSGFTRLIYATTARKALAVFS
jgi:uncharacterized membrane protein HdeD (DUF308 family)